MSTAASTLLTRSAREINPSRKAVFHQIVQRIQSVRKKLYGSGNPGSCQGDFLEMGRLFRTISEPQCASLCESLALLCVGSVSNDLSNGSIEMQRLVHHAVQSLYSALFNVFLDANVGVLHSRISEPLKRIELFTQKHQFKPQAEVLSSIPVKTDSAPVVELKAMTETVRRPPEPEKKTGSDGSEEVTKKLISFIDRIQKLQIESPALHQSLLDSVAFLNERYTVRLQDAIDSVRSETRIQWQAVNPEFRISRAVVPFIEKLLGDYSSSVAPAGFCGVVDAKSVGAYFIMSFCMGPENTLGEQELLAHLDRVEERTGATYVDLLRGVDGNIYYEACMEPEMPFFFAFETVVAGKKVIVPKVNALKFVKSIDSVQATLIPTARLFGVEAKSEPAAYAIIALGNSQYAVPVEAYLPAKCYIPATRDPVGLRKYGCAGTARIKDGEVGSVLDLSIMVERWVQKFGKQSS